MKYIVYITKNLINGKCYIGKHKTEDPNTFDGYLGLGCYATRPSTYMHPKYPFQFALKKYGPKNFIRSTIKVFDTEEEAFNLEKELVTEEVVNSPEYYNVSLGGNGPQFPMQKVYQYSINGKYIKEWKNADEVTEFYNLVDLYGALRHRIKAANFYWSYEKVEQLDMSKYSHPNIPKMIYEYNLQGKCVGVYESMHKVPGINPGRISVCISCKKSYKGHYYSYVLQEIYKPYNKTALKSKTLYAYDNDGKLCFCTQGVTELLHQIGGRSREGIYNAVISGKPYKGYRIFTEKQDNIGIWENKNKSKKVDVFDLYGTLLKTYNSINEAVKDLKLDNSSAHRVIKGTQQQTKGYILKIHKKIV